MLKYKKQEIYEVDWSHDQTLKDFSEHAPTKFI